MAVSPKTRRGTGPLRAQIAQFGVHPCRTGTNDLAARKGGSRNYARSRLVTLGERLPGSLPVQCKIQERSHDPRHQ